MRMTERVYICICVCGMCEYACGNTCFIRDSACDIMLH